MTQRIVVLGSKGFLGSHLTSFLSKKGHAVRGIPSSEIDLLNPDSVGKLSSILTSADSLVFVSALTPDRGRDVATLMKNLTMAQHVAEVLAVAPPARLVYVSSDAVYPDACSLINEDTPLNPSSFHGIMHTAREGILRQTSQQRSVPFLTVRPSAVYGPGDTHNGYGPNRFLRTALKDGTISLFGAGEEKRDHIYIDDFCEIIHRVLHQPLEGALNAVSGASVTFGEVAETVRSLLEREIVIERQPRGGEPTHRHFDTTKLAVLFAGQPRTDIRSGLKAALKSWEN